MKLISTAIGAAFAAWAVSRVLRHARRQQRAAHKEAVTRWEGEGGSIPAVERGKTSPPYSEGGVAS